MNTDKVIIESAKKTVRAIKIDSRRRDLDGVELAAAIIANDVYRKSKSNNLSLIKRFFSFIADIFRWNKSVKPKKEDPKPWINSSFLRTADGFLIVTENQEKIKINE